MRHPKGGKRKVSQNTKLPRIYTENPDKSCFWANNLFFSIYYVIFSCRNFGLQTFLLYLQISWSAFEKGKRQPCSVKTIFYLSTNNKLKNLWQTKESIPLVMVLLKVTRQ